MKKVVIVGAGPAGLTAAYKLLKDSNDYEVTILEADSLIGGISKTIDFNGYKVDIGGHRFFTKNDEINEIWNSLVPLQNKPAYDDIVLNRNKSFGDTGSDPEKDEASMLIRDRISRIYYRGKFYDYPVTLNMKTITNFGFFTLIKVGFSYIKAQIFKKEESSLENFYINRFGKQLYEMFFKNYTEKVWGRSPSEISADWGNQRVKGLSIAEIIKDVFRRTLKIKNKNNTETSLIETYYYPKLGAKQMWDEMAKKIESYGGKIIFNAKVDKINLKNGNVKSVEYESSSKKYVLPVDILISSMPLKDLVNSMENIDIPKKILDIANGLPYREFMSVCILSKNINLKNNTKIKTMGNIIPDSWIYVQEPDIKMGRMQIFNNWSPYIFKDKTKMSDEVLFSCEYFCSENDDVWKMSDKDFIEYAKKDAINAGIINEGDIKDAKRIKVKKAYPAYFDTYSKIDELIEFLNTIDNLYCIGRNGQHRYNNMDHSMMTGIETAKNIIQGKNDKSNIWNVNTEDEYHETKKCKTYK